MFTKVEHDRPILINVNRQKNYFIFFRPIVFIIIWTRGGDGDHRFLKLSVHEDGEHRF